MSAPAQSPPDRSMAPILEFSQVSKRFGGLEALSGIDLRVMPGEICSVIGPNGAGKTTLFNLASCLLKPTTGSVRFDGEDITGLPAHKLAQRGLARTFQNLAVFKHETVIANILTGMHSRLGTGIFGAAVSGAPPATRKSAHVRRPRRSSSSSRSNRSAICRWEPCPMACKSGWSWAVRSPCSPNFCCSTRWSPA